MGKTWTVGVRTITAEKEQLKKVVAKLTENNRCLLKLSEIQQKVIEQWKHLYYSKPTTVNLPLLITIALSLSARSIIKSLIL